MPRLNLAHSTVSALRYSCAISAIRLFRGMSFTISPMGNSSQDRFQRLNRS